VQAQLADDVAKRLCDGRVGCVVAEPKDAGQDDAGRSLTLVEVALERTTERDGVRCRPHVREFWVVAGAGQAASTTRLMSLCNDGYGAAGVGEDTVTVGSNQITYEKSGGSNWRWTGTRVIQLAPARILSERHCSYFNGAPGFQIDVWDWQRFTGQGLMRFQPGKPSDKDEVGCTSPMDATHRYLSIPKLTDAGGVSKEGAVVLGSCAIALRDDGSFGYFVHGAPGPTGGAAVRLLLAGNRDLLVTVEDSAIAGADNWVNSDHLEVWQGGLMSIDRSYLTSDPLVQYGVRLTDGKVFAGYGRPTALPAVAGRRVEDLAGGRGRISLRLRLPRDANAITVVYSKAVGGRQARMVATSPVKYGKADSLGGTFSIADKAARCALRNGRLDVVEAGGLGSLVE
jgi:hypothetical protein